MKNFLCSCILLLIFAGCKPGLPKDIIQPGPMGDILYDIHIADGYIATMPNQDSAKKVSAAFYQGIYRKFGTDSAGYTRSMNYYADHPAVLGPIYEQVTEKLKKTKDSVEKQNEKRLKREAKVREAAQKKTRDSLRKVADRQQPAAAKQTVKPLAPAVQKKK